MSLRPRCASCAGGSKGREARTPSRGYRNVTELESLRHALRRIRDYDASRPEGYLDEWQEADAFAAVQQIASETLDPWSGVAARAESRRIERETRQRKRTLLRSIGANTRWYIKDNAMSGVWVRVLPKGVEQSDLVEVRVLKVVGSPISTLHRHVGATFTVNVWNLHSASRVAELGGVCA